MVDIILTAAIERTLKGENYYQSFLDYLENSSPLGITGRRMEDMVQYPDPVALANVLLGTALRKAGFSVLLVDNLVNSAARMAKLEELLRESPPTAIGLSTTHIYSSTAIDALLKRFKEIVPGITTILGGPTVARCPELARLADVTVFGEGEDCIVEIMRCLKGGRSLGSVPGIAYWEGGRLLTTETAGAGSFDTPRFPDWELAHRRPEECFLLETARGCRYGCRFCTYPRLFPGRVRYRNVANVIDEMRRNYEHYGIQLYRIVDASFTTPAERCEDICNRVTQAALPIQWSCFGRVDDMNPTLCASMKAAGCYAIFFGVESGDDEILRAMAKGYCSDRIVAGIRDASEAGIITHGNFIVGFPGETRETIENTWRVIEQSGLDLTMIAVFWLNQKCYVHDNRDRYGIAGEGTNWHHSTMTSKEAAGYIQELMERLSELERPVLGNELFFPIFMSMGLSKDEVLRFFRDIHFLTREQALAVTELEKDDVFMGVDPSDFGDTLDRMSETYNHIRNYVDEYWRRDPLIEALQEGLMRPERLSLVRAKPAAREKGA